MSHPLLQRPAIDQPPGEYLRTVGVVFAEFGTNMQDSGNISYGVQVGNERYFVKTAGLPLDPLPLLDHAGRVALLWNAARLSASVNHPLLPKLMGIIESPDGPLLVTPWLDGEFLRRLPFINDMGQMFGSTRFMAPEEFERGALIDEQTTVFVMGRTALIFLSDGTLAPELFRGPRTLFDVVRQACQPIRANRFASMAAFSHAWQAARDV